jgi:ABC-2 type transport system permease protein
LKEHIHNAITDHMIFEKTAVSRHEAGFDPEPIRYRRGGRVMKTRSKAQGVQFDLSYVVGYASGFLIYLLTFIYGAAVMRGVMEEKTNRIAEVMVSSVRPFELMMGKITGIGAVGLTQFLLWIVSYW